jgi:hypothetical protein
MVCWPNRPMPYDIHKRQTYCLANNVSTCVKKKPLLKPLFVIIILCSVQKPISIHYWLITLPCYILRQHNPIINKDASLWTWNSTCQFSDNNISASIYFCLIIYRPSNIPLSTNIFFVFLANLVIGAIIVLNVFIKHL